MSLSRRIPIKRKTPLDEPGGIYTRTDLERLIDHVFIGERMLRKMPTKKIHEELLASRDYQLSIQTVRADVRRIEDEWYERFRTSKEGKAILEKYVATGYKTK